MVLALSIYFYFTAYYPSLSLYNLLVFLTSIFKWTNYLPANNSLFLYLKVRRLIFEMFSAFVRSNVYQAINDTKDELFLNKTQNSKLTPELLLISLRKHAFSNILNISPPTKNWKFLDKNSDIFFYISAQNIDCGYSLEQSRRGGSNEYPQIVFLSRKEK